MVSNESCIALHNVKTETKIIKCRLEQKKTRADAPPLRDSIPYRPKGYHLCTILIYAVW